MRNCDHYVWIAVAVTIAGVASCGDTARGFCDGSAVSEDLAPLSAFVLSRWRRPRGVPSWVAIRSSFRFLCRFCLARPVCALAGAI